MNIPGLNQNLVLQEIGPDFQVPVENLYGILFLYRSRCFWVILALCFLMCLDAILCFLFMFPVCVFFPLCFQFLIGSGPLKSLSEYSYSNIALPL